VTARRPSYGWAVVVALSITETTSWGVLFYGFPVFLKPMEADLGWSRVQITGAFSLALAAQGASGVWVGRWLDAHSPRALMTAGSVAATALVVGWSRVGSLTAFYALWVAAGVVMATVLYEPAFTVVTKWFPGEGRRAALTTVTLVAGLASFIFLPLENQLIASFGWRKALMVLAAVLGLVTIPLHLLVLRAPAGIGRGGSAAVADAADRILTEPPAYSLGATIRFPAFWLLATAFVLSSFVTSALAVHQVAYLQERGYTAAFAATATGVLGAMQLPGRLLFGPLSRRVPRPRVTTLVFATFAVGLAILAAGTNTATVWLFVIVYGAGRGMSTLLRATLVGDLFGARHYGSIAGALALPSTVALAAAPVLAGVLYEQLGGYRPVLWLLVVAAAGAVLAASQVERRPIGPAPGPAS
jgi:MFS family permease